MVDREGFSAAAQALAPTLYRVAVSILRHPQDAQDAAQEALAKAWARRDSLREATLKPYLVRVTINECRNIQRQRMRQTPMAELPEEGVPPTQADLDLQRALQALPDSLRLPILLRYMEGWTDGMIAAALRTTAVAVRARLSRARKRLKAALDDPARGGAP